MEAAQSLDFSVAGGSVVVILSKDFDLPSDFAFHPQIVPLQAAELPAHPGMIGERLPSTTKMVLIGGELPGPKFGILRTVMTRRNLPFQVRKNPTAFQAALASFFPKKAETPHTVHRVPPAAVVDDGGNGNGNGNGTAPPEKQAIGVVSQFVRAEADLSKGSAEEARRLMPIAAARGIRTTLNSLAQAISVAKRKGGRTETPRSIMSPQQNALKTLDETLAGLQLVREYVADTEALNLELNRKLTVLTRALKEVVE